MNNERQHVIEVINLTKDYGFGRGVFNINIHVKKGEVLGFLGPNGAGKTTTIRHLMGFSVPQEGKVFINGLSCFENSKKIQKILGYLPGEIALPENSTIEEFINDMSKLRQLKSKKYVNELMKIFKFDIKNRNIKLKRLSLGEKRKLAIITAFMHDPDILILDEPTSGLDPIGQLSFIDFIHIQRQRGKTILLSSHLFQEVEKVCNRVSIIKDGKIIDTRSMDSIKYINQKKYIINFNDLESFNQFKKSKFKINYENRDKLEVNVQIDDEQINELLNELIKFDLSSFFEEKYTLEDYFMHFYSKNKEVQ